MGELNPNSRFKKQGMDSAFLWEKKLVRDFVNRINMMTALAYLNC
ncbi:hypothetical protein J504_1542 [Acinetobacter baumannii 348935]|nr:hypothetical protein J504_1542 [Acinetobacter baumannii 348935]